LGTALEKRRRAPCQSGRHARRRVPEHLVEDPRCHLVLRRSRLPFEEVVDLDAGWQLHRYAPHAGFFALFWQRSSVRGRTSCRHRCVDWSLARARIGSFRRGCLSWRMLLLRHCFLWSWLAHQPWSRALAAPTGATSRGGLEIMRAEVAHTQFTEEATRAELSAQRTRHPGCDGPHRFGDKAARRVARARSRRSRRSGPATARMQPRPARRASGTTRAPLAHRPRPEVSNTDRFDWIQNFLACSRGEKKARESQLELAVFVKSDVL